MNSLRFGTSGLRGLAAELEGAEAQRYTRAFVRHLRAQGMLGSGRVLIGQDSRPSSSGIALDCAAAMAAEGLRPIDCGQVPTPALALQAMAGQAAAIMVTGSHIPANRNGLKFYTPVGEITKDDELGITAALGEAMALAEPVAPLSEHEETAANYLKRYTSLLPSDVLSGWRIGVFEHSSVARTVLGQVLAAAGADVVGLGRVEQFVAVDTEAFEDAVFDPLAVWIREHRLDAIVSSDGDGDRPLLMDGDGKFVRGDVLGLLAAQYLGADAVVTPVTSNSAIERTGLFATVVRTRVGSPYVIAGMQAFVAAGALRVVGFEANGGTLLGNAVLLDDVALSALPTRDAVLPLVAALSLAARAGQSVAELVATLPVRASAAGRLEDVAQDLTADFLARLRQAGFAADFFSAQSGIVRMSDIDGLRFELADGGTVHYRASGNAPELRCYVEAPIDTAAADLLRWGLAAALAHLDR